MHQGRRLNTYELALHEAPAAANLVSASVSRGQAGPIFPALRDILQTQHVF
jgi:hypothetical protein